MYARKVVDLPWRSQAEMGQGVRLMLALLWDKFMWVRRVRGKVNAGFL